MRKYPRISIARWRDSKLESSDRVIRLYFRETICETGSPIYEAVMLSPRQRHDYLVIEALMRRLLFVLALLLWAISLPLQSQEQKTARPGHYLFAWTGDAAKQGNDFLAVIDADPASPSYGHLMTTVVTDQQTKMVYHTEYTMPASGMLFANDHNAGRTFIFDLRDPLHPKVAASFTDMAGFMHPHSYLRLPNGHVLAALQHAHHAGNSEDMTAMGMDNVGSSG